MGVQFRRGVMAAVGLGALATAASVTAAPTAFRVTNLVSDGFVPAAHIDPNLINPWGISYGPTGPFWVSDNNSGVSTLYDGTGAPRPLVVSVPAGGGAPGGTPTGQVFNGGGGFNVASGGKTGSSVFLFATEGGTISGWAPSVNPTNAFNGVDNSLTGAVYKGLAIGSTGGASYLYAANFNAGTVERYDSAFNLAGTFTDPGVAAGYAPFNVQNLGGTLYVTYALQDAAKHDDVAGAGNGYVDAFDLNGNFLHRVVSLGGALNSPWGLDIAPSSFGTFAGDLLVGNFGDGTISAFDPVTGTFQGYLSNGSGQALVLGDLWGLINGNGGSGGSTDALYFAAGVSHEAHGLFGSITPAPEPAAWALMLTGFGIVGASVRRRRSVGAIG